MKIALDYDETFTEAPVFWGLVVNLAKQHGHEICFVTYRDHRWGNDDIELDAESLGIEIIYTCGKQKAGVYDADVWIDDMPVCIPKASELGDMFDGCLLNNDVDFEVMKDDSSEK